MQSDEKRGLTLLFTINLIIISFSMRSPMGGVGPLVSHIETSLNLSNTAAGLITTLPLLCFAVSSLLGGFLIRKVKVSLLVKVYLFVLTLGVFLRSILGIFGLYTGTILIGLGTGLLNVTVPSLIKTFQSKRASLLNGLYSSSMTLSSALTAFFITILFSLLKRWELALAVTGIFSFVAFFISLFVLKGDRVDLSIALPFKSLLKKRNIFVGLFMGLQSLIFYSMLSWYPTIMAPKCSFKGNTGTIFTIMQLSSLIPAFVIPVITNKKNLRVLSETLALLFVPGILIAYFSSHIVLNIIGTIICGLSLGGTFSMSITFCSLYGRNSTEVASILSLGQFIGYSISSIGPVLIGATYDYSYSWNSAIYIMSILALLMVIFAYIATKKEKENV